LHPSIPKSVQLKFWATDSKELFERNKETAPEDWMYHNADITYNFNAHGFRQKKELADINQDNYIYSTGGCISLGVGVNEEDRYTDIVANSLGMDLVTWGSPLGSLKFQAINFMNMLNDRIAFITALAGKDVVNEDIFKQVCDIAKVNGATKIQCAARESAAKLYKQVGMKERHIILEATL
jgi:hypothetical protein